MGVIVGVADGGFGSSGACRVISRADFAAGTVDPGRPAWGAAHGSEVAAILLAHAPPAAAFLDARVLDSRGRAGVDALVQALDWLVANGAQVINLSLGITRDDPRLAASCRQALDAGCVLVAAAPARGPAVYPGALPGVLSVCGDARCTPGELSWLGGEPADLGACPRPLDGPATRGGASCAAAHASARIARLWLEGARDGQALRAALRAAAVHHGREHRQA